VVLLYSLEETDVIAPPKIKREAKNIQELRELRARKKEEFVSNFKSTLVWLFRWMPDEQVRSIEKLGDVAQKFNSSSDSGDENDLDNS